MTAPARGLHDETIGESASSDMVAEARALLEEQRRVLRRRIDEFAGDVDDLQTATATLGQGETELASRHTNVELRTALDTASQDLLDDVMRALARIDDGTYGVCVACGQDIGVERLRALPQVDRCIRCQASTRARQPGSVRP